MLSRVDFICCLAKDYKQRLSSLHGSMTGKSSIQHRPKVRAPVRGSVVMLSRAYFTRCLANVFSLYKTALQANQAYAL